MHASHDPRLVRFLDGLSLSFAMLEHVHSELHAACSTLTTNKERLPVAFWLCWSFVDAVHRVRELAQAIPGLGRQPPELRVFLDATSDAEGFRNYIQHLRGELSKRGQDTFPVWGALAWVDPLDPQLSHIALAGAQIGETHYHGCVFDAVNKQYVSTVCLTVGGLAFHFDRVFAACIRFRDFIVPWVQSTYAPGIHLTEELPVVTVRFANEAPGK